MGTLKPQSNGPLFYFSVFSAYVANKLLHSNTVINTLAVDGWTVTFGTASRDGRGRSPPKLLLAVPNVTAHPSTAVYRLHKFILFNVPL